MFSCVCSVCLDFGFLDFWISIFLDFWISGFLDLWISVFLDFLILDFWGSGFLDYVIANLFENNLCRVVCFAVCFRYVGISGFLDFCIFGFLDFWISGFLDF